MTWLPPYERLEGRENVEGRLKLEYHVCEGDTLQDHSQAYQTHACSRDKYFVMPPLYLPKMKSINYIIYK